MKALLFLLLLFSTTSKAQTAADVINKHIKAIGGKANLDAISSYSFQQGQTVVYFKKPNKWRIDFMEDGKVTQTTIFHGEKGWVIHSTGEAEPSYSGMDSENFLAGLLAYAQAPDFKVEFLGNDTESDNLVIKISSQTNNAKGYISFTYYINPKTYMVTRMRHDLSGTAKTIVFQEYKIVNGLQVPTKTLVTDEYSPVRSYQLRSDIKINPVLDDKLFVKPPLKKRMDAYEASGGKYGYRDENGVTIIRPKYDNVWSFNDDGLAKVVLNKLYGFVDMKGREVIKLQYDDVDNVFADGLASVKLKERWGYINKSGQMLIPATYEAVQMFRNKMACVKLNGKWGSIDTKGKTIIPFEYEYIGFFTAGKADVKKDGVKFQIDPAGRKIN